jgi:ubiquinone/menaquinone biosynthesis C-methylase UbiE
MDKLLIPPKELDYGIKVDHFQATGEEYAEHCRRLAALTPDSRVLDVGCGFAPLGAALTEYLSSAGSYEGIDVVRTGVEWAAQTMTPRFPNFRFTWVDVFNSTYHQAGQLDPRSFRFPFADNEFDLVYLRSVFTHMLPPEVSHYMAEIRRVMKPSGRSFITYFLLNEESIDLMTGDSASRNFSYDYGIYRQTEPGPYATIAYQEDYIRELYRRHHLSIAGTIHYGRWCGRADGWSSQDIVIAMKGV